MSQLTTIAVQQSDNTAFLLREHIIIKADVAILKADVADLKQGQLDMNNKLDLILSKLN